MGQVKSGPAGKSGRTCELGERGKQNTHGKKGQNFFCFVCFVFVHELGEAVSALKEVSTSVQKGTIQIICDYRSTWAGLRQTANPPVG